MRFLSLIILTLCYICLYSKISHAQDNDFKQPVKIIVKDSTKYSKRYLERLRGESSYGTIYKIEDSLITVNGDSGIFPYDLPLNKQKIFIGYKNDKSFELILERINYTSVNYEIKISQNSRQVLEKIDQADLNALFFIASGADEDDSTGMGYLVDKYYEERDSLFIQIAVGVNENEQLKVRFSLFDEKSNKEIGDCPTLSEKP